MKLRISKWEAKAGNELVENGLIRVNPNKPEFGSMMVISTSPTMNNGFLNIRNKVGFIVGKVADLKNLISTFGLKEGDDYSQKVTPSRIVTIEKVESEVTENQGFRQKINPQTDEPLTKDGEFIYWKTEVVAEGSDIQDTLLTHDRVTVTDNARAEFAAVASQTK